MADLIKVWKVYNEPNSIQLPESLEMFCNLRNGKRFAIDIGSSLTKIAYYSSTKHRKSSHSHKRKTGVNKLNLEGSSNLEQGIGESSNSNQTRDLSVDCSNPERTSTLEEDNTNQVEQINESTSQLCSQKKCQVEEKSSLHFIIFHTPDEEKWLNFIETHIIGNKELVKGKRIKVTGSGVEKYAKLMEEKLGVLIDKEDEMCCLIKGINFLLKNVAKEAFVYRRKKNPQIVFQDVDSQRYPYLLVNIGSAVSIIKVIKEDFYVRIGGMTAGGATFCGLGKLLTSANDYDGLLEFAEKGNYKRVNLLVRDLYGNGCDSAGLSGDSIAASFGKINFTKGECRKKKFSEADIARSLLFTFLNNIGHVISLYALLHKAYRVYFGGCFLRNNPINMDILSLSVDYWSDRKVEALFLRHEGYLGAVGAFLKGTELWKKEVDVENFSGNVDSVTINRSRSSQGEGGNSSEGYCCCPLLKDPEGYCPDTMDLLQDDEAREYWLECFVETVEKLSKKAVESQRGSSTAEKRAEGFELKFLFKIQSLKLKPSAYGPLSVRSLLDTIEQLLHEFEFPDPYLEQKKMENKEAIKHFAKHVADLDKLEWNTRQHGLIWYLVAGNMFDWGAKVVSAMLEKNSFGFSEALKKIPPRPWLLDSLDEWVTRMKGPPHKCAVVFVDNSGFDIILGVLPFVRELLKRGTEVILCSNSSPALNDVTHPELLDILEEIKELCPIIREAEEKGNLIAMENGQTGPCLDLSRLNPALCEEMVKRKADLIVIEGMGRSVHTNLQTHFKCESLKVAVIKNRWLAQRLGGDIFCVICQYQNESNL